MKEKKDNIIKRWYRLAEPNKMYWFIQIVFYIIYAVFLSIITIFAAKTIDYMYDRNWVWAFAFLGFELGNIIVRNLAYHIQYIFYAKQYGYIREKVTQKIYNKLLSCESVGLKDLSREKILNIAINNMSYLSEFPDAVAGFIAYSFQVIMTLVIVFVANPIAGLIVTLLGIVNFFVYYTANKKLGRFMLERFDTKDDIFKTLNKVINGRDAINELSGKEKYAGEVLDKTKNFSKAYLKYYKTYSFKNNLWYAIWNIVVYAITAFLLFLVSKNSLDMSIYLIIVPYLTTCTDKLNSLFDKTNSLENMRVDVDRVNMILDMSDRELVRYGEFNNEVEGYNLGLIDVDYENVEEGEVALKNADISFKMRGVNVIKGERGSGKRLIFNLLRRRIKPTSGKILLDNLDLYEYNQKTFPTHISYCSSHPSFVPGTIKENLLLMEKDFTKIKSMCERIGVHKFIVELPNEYDTYIEDIHSSEVLFLLGLVRACLSKCKVLMVYEIPQDAEEEFRQYVVKFLTSEYIDKTVILFTHSNDYDNIANICYKVEKGRVKPVKLK